MFQKYLSGSFVKKLTTSKVCYFQKNKKNDITWKPPSEAIN